MKDKIEVLKEDVVVPDIVLSKANEAFNMIRREEKPNGAKGMAGRMKRRPPIRLRRIFILAAAMALALGTVGFAYYVKWSRGLEHSLHTTEEVKKEAIETNLADFPEQSVTVSGVTVTVRQSIVDNYYAYLAFEVKGYDLPEGGEPGFDSVNVLVDGEDVDWCGSFYGGIVTNEDGSPVYEDGTPLQNDESGNLLTRYVAQDGTMEYQINLSAGGREGYFLGKSIHVELADLGTYPGKAMPVSADVEGKWEFDWTLKGSDEIYKAELNEPLDGTNVSVIGAEISPVSIKAVYDAPRTVIAEPAENEAGEAVTHETYAEPPALAGVKLKDGTLYPYIYMGPGQMGYVDETSDRYVEMFAVDRILDVNQVEALLFRKSDGGSGTADDYYVVNIR